MTTRREVMGGLAGMAVAGAVGGIPVEAAQPARPLFAGTSLARNSVAAHFQRVDMRLPTVSVLTATGTAPLSGIGGKARLIALWAEWCVPCLVEIRDFAAQRPALANDRFDIGLVLTASNAKLDREGALAKLRPLGATGLPLVIEPAGGRAIAQALAALDLAPEIAASLPKGAKVSSFSLPCTLLVDPRGRVRGRTFGAAMIRADGSVEKPELTEEQKAALKRGERVVGKAVTESYKAELMDSGRTMWAGKDGQAFLRALSEGALDRV